MRGAFGILVVIASLFVCLVIVIGIASVTHRAMPVEVQTGEKIICSDSQHQGDRILTDNIQTISVPRKEVNNYSVKTKETVCLDCQARREEKTQQARIRKEREEHKARERAEIEEIMGNLRVEFEYVLGPDRINPRGSIIFGFRFRFENLNSSPIKNVRIGIEAPENIFVIYSGKERLISGERERIEKLTSRGIKIKDIRPSHSPYYPSGPVFQLINVGLPTASVWQYDEIGDLYVNRDILTPGTDLTFRGFVVIKDHKIPVGTVTVHVMYPE